MDQNSLLILIGVFFILSVLVGFGAVYVINLWQRDRQRRFGDDFTFKSDRIEFGEPLTNDSNNYYEVKPPSVSRTQNDQQIELCPLCRQVVISDDLYVCSGCQTSFHKTHYDEFYEEHGYCPNCRGSRQR